MNLKEKKDFIRKIPKSLACAYVYIVIVVITTFALFSKNIEKVFSYANIVSVEKKETIKKEVKINEETKRLNKKPSYGMNYGRIKIEKLDIDLPLYYGTTLDILKNGVGIYGRAYCPGEGRSIILTGHNTEGFLKRLPEIKKKDEIIMEMDYGTYKYKVIDTKILSKDDESILEVQREKEVLVIYTSYPVGNIGNSDKVFITYAEPIK